jgi:hypothetical protein
MFTEPIADRSDRQDHKRSPRIASCCDPRSLFGWSPADLPADTSLKRGVDRFLPRRGAGAVAYFVAVAVLVSLLSALPTRAGLLAFAAGSLAGSLWCGVNFWRCRHAHCVVTSIGWLGIAGVAVAGAILGRSLTGGNEGNVFLAVLVAAVLFEALWYWTRHTNAVTRDQRAGS